MHPRILAERTAIAAIRLTAAANRLAEALELPAEMVNDLTPDDNHVQVRPMLVLEACANLVEAAADKLAGTANKLAQPVEIEPIPPIVIETPEGEITLELTQSPAPIAETSDAGAKPKVKRGGTE